MTSTAGIALAALPIGAKRGSAALAAGQFGFQTGLRRLHVSASGASPLDGAPADVIFRTIQEAVDAARPGDVVTVAAGLYRERPAIHDKLGTSEAPIWIVAEQRGAVIISDTWQEAEEGKVAWTHEGDGVYAAPCFSRPYIGEHAGDFLMAYLSKEDLTADTIEAYSAIARENRVIKKPPYGFAFVPTENRLYVRLRDGADPNGQSIRFTKKLARPTITAERCHHLILDGFIIEGAGNIQAVLFDDDSMDVTVRNCVFRLARHGVRCPPNTILDTCTYHYVGFDRWSRDLYALDGTENHGVFVLVKAYYHAKAVGAGKRGNALLEGSLDFGRNFAPTSTNLLIDNCLIGPCFDGSRIGEFNNSRIRNTVFVECRDDGFQNEGPKKGIRAKNNRIHDCRFINCFHDTSHQNRAVGNAFIYRNLIEWNDAALAIPDNYSIKMIRTSKEANIYYYHNTWIIDYGRHVEGRLRVWADFGGKKSNANMIEMFANNIVVIPQGLSDGPGPNPVIIASNAVVGSSARDTDFLTANGGIYAGPRVADMGLDADHSLLPNSPARHIGLSLPKDLPDSRTGPDANKDAGAFPFGEKPGSNWPRPATLVFNEDLPSRWPSPGGNIQ
jgi:hypothetical protein